MSVTLTADESLTFAPANRFKGIQELANVVSPDPTEFQIFYGTSAVA